MKILLWDIDGTLIRSGRAGLRAMNQAARDVLGLAGAFDDFDFAGRTDPWALATIARHHKLELPADTLAQFYRVYVEHLRTELHNPQAQAGAGVRWLLTFFAGEERVTQGLLTGNMRAGARAKLEHFGLWQHFPFGAFGDDSGDRNALGPVALRRACDHLGREDLRPSDLVVVGDTPHDAECARAFGARCVLVATGRYSLDELAAHRPDLLVADFADARPLQELVAALEP